MSETYSLFDLHKYVKQVFALNFGESIWIHAEISQAKEVRGQVYINLIEKSEQTDDVIAQANAIIQFRSLLSLRKKLGKILDSILDEGVAVKIKVRLEFHERYGYKLMIEDIDPSYTLGQLEIHRQKILERLDMEGLIHLNESQSIPTVAQRLALITSETAAGYKDFIATLEQNKYQYAFKIDLYQTSMQGKNTATELVRSMNRILASKDKYDVIIIIRGGGAKLDLASFDHYNIGYAIATSELPVICGIGHEIDNTIADIVAHTSLKTPTAVAEYIVNRAMHFESDLMDLGRIQQEIVKDRLHQHIINLNDLSQSLKFIPLQRIHSHSHLLKQLRTSIENDVNQKLRRYQYSLKNYQDIVKLSDPIHILKKGFSMTRKKGKIITSAHKLKKNDTVELVFHDGTKDVTVE